MNLSRSSKIHPPEERGLSTGTANRQVVWNLLFEARDHACSVRRLPSLSPLGRGIAMTSNDGTGPISRARAMCLLGRLDSLPSTGWRGHRLLRT
jgi:hypothetical protein